MKRIYISCPYSDLGGNERKEAVKASQWVAERLMLDDMVVFSSIAHRKMVSNAALNDWLAWEPFCFSILERWAEALYIVPVEGWRQSADCLAELSKAQSLGLKIGIVALNIPSRPLTVTPW